MATIPPLFEVGILRRVPSLPHLFRAETLLVFPLLPGPSSISWSDPPRDDVQQAPGGSTHTKGGRGLASCQISGTFGVAVRAFGMVSGTGPERLKRFRNEVVALSSAVDRDEIEEVVRDAALGVTGAASDIGVQLGNVLARKLADFDPANHVTYCNFYDFMNRRFHRIGKVDLRHSLQARGGGAVEMQTYQLSFVAYGTPIVDETGRVWPKAIQGLCDILPTWQRVNDTVSSTTLTAAIENASVILDSTLATPLLASISAVSAQVESLTSLASGAILVDNTGLSSLLGTCESLGSQLKVMAETLSGSEDAYAPDPTTSEIDWSAELSEPVLDTYTTAKGLYEAAGSLDFQRISGRFLGMADDEYAAFLAAGGQAGGASPTVRSTVDHVVTVLDTPEAIAARYGLGWVDIVRVNRLASDQVVPGAVLKIPRTRTWGTLGIDGLPVFGSHVGDGALGRDIKLPMAADAYGRLETVQGLACLEQGTTLRQYGLAEQVLDGTDGIPPEGKAGIVSVKTRLVFAQDPRVRDVRVTATASANSASLALDVQLRTINGVAGRLSAQDTTAAVWDAVVWDGFSWA